MSKREQEPKLVRIFRLVPKIENTLRQMDQPINKGNPNTLNSLKEQLKEQVREWYISTQQLLLENQSGISNGFKADAFGILTGTTDFDKEDMKQKFSNSHLINIFAKEIAEEEALKVSQNNLPINPTELLIECSDESKPTVDLNLTNGDQISFDKTTGDATVQTADGKTHKFKSFFGGVKNLVKNIWGWIIKKYESIKKWFSELFKKPNEKDIVKESDLDSILETTINEASNQPETMSV